MRPCRSRRSQPSTRRRRRWRSPGESGRRGTRWPLDTAAGKTAGMIGVYAGRFDPVTNGHLDIARRASKLFEQLIVAVYELPADRSLFGTDERISMLEASLVPDANVSVERFSGLLTDFVRERGADTIVR